MNHWDQLFCGIAYQFLSFQPQKRQKYEFLDPKIGTADNKNAIKKPFFGHFEPQKRYVRDIQEKSQSLGSSGSLF